MIQNSGVYVIWTKVLKTNQFNILIRRAEHDLELRTSKIDHYSTRNLKKQQMSELGCCELSQI